MAISHARGERYRKRPIFGGCRKVAEDVGVTRFLFDTGIAADYINRRRGV